MCTRLREGVRTGKWSGAEDLVAHMSWCQDPGTATGQMMCLSSAARGIHFLCMCIHIYPH